MRLWAVHREIANPPEINRMGMRFINSITIPRNKRTLDDLLAHPPTPPKDFDLPFLNYLQQAELAVPGYPAYAVTRVQTIQSLPSNAPEEMWNLTLCSDPIEGNPNHVTIKGWSGDKAAQKMIAQEIAAKAHYVPNPTRS